MVTLRIKITEYFTNENSLNVTSKYKGSTKDEIDRTAYNQYHLVIRL